MHDYYPCRDSCLPVCYLRNTKTTIHRTVTSSVVSMSTKLSYIKGKTYTERVGKYVIEENVS
jgi:hypothetical protein